MTVGGPTRTTWPRSSNARSPPATPPAPSYVSAPPASARSRHLDDFDFDHQPGARTPVQALASGAWLAEHRNIVFLGPPGTGKTHLATALGVTACRQGQRVLFATATDWVARLGEVHDRGRLRRADPIAPLRADHRRRGRLPALRTGRREPLLPARLLPLRARLAGPDQEPAVQLLGRRLRRPGRRRRDDRPHRPPRRRHRPQRRLLPPARPRHRHPAQHQSRAGLHRLQTVHSSNAGTVQFSSAVDRHRASCVRRSVHMLLCGKG